MSTSRLLVSDLVDRPGEWRKETFEVDLDVRVGEVRLESPATVEVVLSGIDDGVLARFQAEATGHMVCTRCLTEWDEPVRASEVQVYEEAPDEDGYRLESGDIIDLGGPVRDELALAIPLRPLCRSDCAGLCPTCGTDLNRDPCGGHDEPPSSPFAALQGLFDDDSPDH